MADDTEKAGWFDWLPWVGDKLEPARAVEKLTVLGMDPLTALLVLVGILAAALALYYDPRRFLRGFAEMMGNMSAVIIGLVVGVGAVVGGAVLYLEMAGLSAMMVFAVIGVIAVLWLFAVAGG